MRQAAPRCRGMVADLKSCVMFQGAVIFACGHSISCSGAGASTVPTAADGDPDYRRLASVADPTRPRRRRRRRPDSTRFPHPQLLTRWQQLRERIQPTQVVTRSSPSVQHVPQPRSDRMATIRVIAKRSSVTIDVTGTVFTGCWAQAAPRSSSAQPILPSRPLMATSPYSRTRRPGSSSTWVMVRTRRTISAVDSFQGRFDALWAARRPSGNTLAFVGLGSDASPRPPSWLAGRRCDE